MFLVSMSVGLSIVKPGLGKDDTAPSNRFVTTVLPGTLREFLGSFDF